MTWQLCPTVLGVRWTCPEDPPRLYGREIGQSAVACTHYAVVANGQFRGAKTCMRWRDNLNSITSYGAQRRKGAT